MGRKKEKRPDRIVKKPSVNVPSAVTPRQRSKSPSGRPHHDQSPIAAPRNSSPKHADRPKHNADTPQYHADPPQHHADPPQHADPPKHTKHSQHQKKQRVGKKALPPAIPPELVSFHFGDDDDESGDSGESGCSGRSPDDLAEERQRPAKPQSKPRGAANARSTLKAKKKHDYTRELSPKPSIESKKKKKVLVTKPVCDDDNLVAEGGGDGVEVFGEVSKRTGTSAARLSNRGELEKEGGMQCSGRELMARWGKENGQQLGLEQGRRLERGLPADTPLQLERPPPTYACVKLMAEWMGAVAELDSATPFRALLADLNTHFVPAEKQKDLETGCLDNGLVLSSVEASGILAAVSGLSASSIRHQVETAVAKRRLLNLCQLSDLIFVLAKPLGATDAQLRARLEVLGKGGVLCPDNVDHYFKLIRNLKDSNSPLNHLLIFGPILAEDHVDVVKGVATLKRVGLMLRAVLPPPADFATLKVIVFLFEVLHHQPGALERMGGGVDLRNHLKVLGCLNRCFMTNEQKPNVMSRKNVQGLNLEKADLDTLKELSIGARHLSITTETRVAGGAKIVQQRIINNDIFKLKEMADVLYRLAHRLFVPEPLYRVVVNELVLRDLLSPEDAVDILGKISEEDVKRGVHFFHVAPLFACRLDLGRLADSKKKRAEGSSTSSRSSDPESSCLSSVSSSAGTPLPAKSPTAAALKPCVSYVTLLAGLSPELLAEMRGASVSEKDVVLRLLEEVGRTRLPKQAAFPTRAYARSLLYMDHTPNITGTKAPAVKSLKTAIEHKRRLGLDELLAIVAVVSQEKVVDEDDGLRLTQTLCDEGALNLDEKKKIIAAADFPADGMAFAQLLLLARPKH